MSEPAAQVQDWATQDGLEAGLAAYLRDADAALEAIAGVVDLPDVVAFSCERVATVQTWGEALWQEVALTDGRRLILWHGEDEENGEVPGEILFSSSLRTIPLAAIVDQGLWSRYSYNFAGERLLNSVLLHLSTQTPERAVTELTEDAGTRTTQYVETYRFSKSLSDGGAAQMERLVAFGRALSRRAAHT